MSYRPSSLPLFVDSSFVRRSSFSWSVAILSARWTCCTFCWRLFRFGCLWMPLNASCWSAASALCPERTVIDVLLPAVKVAVVWHEMIRHWSHLLIIPASAPLPKPSGPMVSRLWRAWGFYYPQNATPFLYQQSSLDAFGNQFFLSSLYSTGIANIKIMGCRSHLASFNFIPECWGTFNNVRGAKQGPQNMTMKIWFCIEIKCFANAIICNMHGRIGRQLSQSHAFCFGFTIKPDENRH